MKQSAGHLKQLLSYYKTPFHLQVGEEGLIIETLMLTFSWNHKKTNAAELIAKQFLMLYPEANVQLDRVPYKTAK